jgi:urease accessory protein
MIVSEVIGNINHADMSKLHIDYVDLEWYELNKKLLRKVSENNHDVQIKLGSNQSTLTEGDVLFADDKMAVVVRVIACECIAIDTHDAQDMARICYEIGNRHAPLFFDETQSNRLLLPMDKPLLAMLQKMHCHTKITHEKLIFPLGGAAQHHHHD